jgi:hypothetical protein
MRRRYEWRRPYEWVDAGLGAADDPDVQGSDFQEGECSFAVGFRYFILVNWVVLRVRILSLMIWFLLIKSVLPLPQFGNTSATSTHNPPYPEPI